MAKAARSLSRPAEVTAADLVRANLYRLLAHVLRAPPQRTDLDVLASMPGDDTPLGQAAHSLSHVARRTTPEAVDREYHELFIGFGRGELVPYGSHYRGGAVHERLPRQGEAARFGILRAAEIGEAEDHIASLCDLMAALILGQFGPPADIEEQRAFFRIKLGSWARQFFTDLEGARSSIFYAAVGKLGATFMDIEEAAFRLE